MTNPAFPALNALTVDVEDYFHASAFRAIAPPESWDRYESRVERNTDRLLEALSERNLRATFFVLGWVAQRFPSLVREIQAAGHEIGCHSYAHRLIYELSPKEFREDTRRAKAVIEDAAGTAVSSYRAATFSITPRSLWALEILLEMGFTTDSSIFPTRNHLYGIPNAPRSPFRIRIQGTDLLEFPLPVRDLAGYGLPVTGGAYLRMLPLSLQIAGIKTMSERHCPAVLYFHPWELDPLQPRLASVWGPKFYHYAGLGRAETRLRRLLARFRFGTLSELSAVPASVPVYEVSEAKKGVVFTRLPQRSENLLPCR